MTRRERECADAPFNDKLVVLTSEEINRGWHFCPDWDGAFVTPEYVEWGPNKDRCYCGNSFAPTQEAPDA